MKTENKYTKQLITNRVLKAIKVSTTLNKPVLIVPQVKVEQLQLLQCLSKYKRKVKRSFFSDGKSEPCSMRDAKGFHTYTDMGLFQNGIEYF